MYFQSFGSMSIIKVKAYWFHVRERGVFGAIFGTLISIGVYLAFDWGGAIVDLTKANATGGWFMRFAAGALRVCNHRGCDLGGVLYSGGDFGRLGAA